VLPQDPSYLYRYFTTAQRAGPLAPARRGLANHEDEPGLDSASKAQSLRSEAEEWFIQRVVRDPLLQRNAGFDPLIASLRRRRPVSPVALDNFFEATVIRVYDESFEVELAVKSTSEEGLILEFMLADLPVDDVEAIDEGALISGVTAHDLTRRWRPTKVTALRLRRTRTWQDDQIAAAAARGAELARQLAEYDSED
jgi:hypothetical protein